MDWTMIATWAGVAVIMIGGLLKAYADVATMKAVVESLSKKVEDLATAVKPVGPMEAKVESQRNQVDELFRLVREGADKTHELDKAVGTIIAQNAQILKAVSDIREDLRDHMNKHGGAL